MLGLFAKVLSYFWRRAGDKEGEDERWEASGRSSCPRYGCVVPEAGPMCGFRALRALGVLSPM